MVVWIHTVISLVLLTLNLWTNVRSQTQMFIWCPTEQTGFISSKCETVVRDLHESVCSSGSLSFISTDVCMNNTTYNNLYYVAAGWIQTLTHQFFFLAALTKPLMQLSDIYLLNQCFQLRRSLCGLNGLFSGVFITDMFNHLIHMSVIFTRILRFSDFYLLFRRAPTWSFQRSSFSLRLLLASWYKLF